MRLTPSLLAALALATGAPADAATTRLVAQLAAAPGEEIGRAHV